jgi:hypothetical protein
VHTAANLLVALHGSKRAGAGAPAASNKESILLDELKDIGILCVCKLGVLSS